MATQGPRFGAGRGSNRITPDVNEDVVRGQARDVGKIREGLSASGKSALTRSAAQEAAGRAITRTLGRAVPAVSALEAGYSAGRELDERTGIGQKMVDKAVGKAIDQMFGLGKVRLSKDAKERIASEDANDMTREGRRSPSQGDENPDEMVRESRRNPSQGIASKPKSAGRSYSSAPPSRRMADSGVREGRNENIDEDTRARAMRSVASEDEEVQAFKKGGAVRGWGKARGARAAKIV